MKFEPGDRVVTHFPEAPACDKLPGVVREKAKHHEMYFVKLEGQPYPYCLKEAQLKLENE